ncbi:MAG TPA: GAF domain-containing protein [Fulvivirga sp.]|nr:GAF domain-containing protein [Fulvivirga sp.]
MAEELIISTTASKKEKYESLLPQIEALISYEDDLIANLANISAALKQGMGFFWVGFYMVKGDELVLGPFQGPIACTRIRMGKGVCGTAWEKNETLLVPNVDEFPGHIACSSASKSEIVIPISKAGKVTLILDVDSEQLDDFDEVDKEWLEKLVMIVEGNL